MGDIIYKEIIMAEFETWLSRKLQEWETDESVFQPYIISILEGEDETEEEKKEGLTGILADCLDNQAAIDNALDEIITNWKKISKSSQDTKNLVEEVKQLDITEKMHAITQQKIASSLVKKVEKSEEEKKLKEAILHGFANGRDDSDDESDDDDAGGDLGPANTNAESVQKEAQEQKEKLAAQAAAKKEKDKQDRINQKSQAEDRKKKAQEKAAKGERKSGR